MSLQDLKAKVAARLADVEQTAPSEDFDSRGSWMARAAANTANDLAKSEKDEERLGRARKEVAGTLSKIVRKSLHIAELISGGDTEESARVLREAKKAVHHIWSRETRDLVEIPDHKTRLAAVTLELAYSEGTPIARSVSVNASPEDSGDALARALQSPALRRRLQAMLESTTVVEAEVVQESGGANSCSTSESEPTEKG